MSDLWTVESLRIFEEQVKALYLTGKLRAPIHLSGGDECQIIEIFRDVKETDWVFSSYRNHYAALLHGIPKKRVLEEILAGHSIHLTFPEFHFFSSAIVGGNLPIAVGVALGIKRRGRTEKVWVLSGDMAAQSGAFHEAVKYARGFDLPITFVVTCNGFSTNTPTYETWRIPHQHITIGNTITRQHLDGWEQGDIIRYCYDRIFPHYGIGVRVDFDQAEKAQAEGHPDVMA